LQCRIRRFLENSLTITSPLTLALVEDDEDVRVALARLLRSMGHRVHLFASAEAYDADPVSSDCLILDVRLPGASGLELRERLRARGSQVPVVFITGESGPTSQDGVRNISQMSEPSLAKPFSDDELMEAIARAMAQAVRQRPTAKGPSWHRLRPTHS
jgi:two-component system, LuxR family, response regulator FixJ